VKIHPYPTSAEQFYRARFTRARISRALHGGKSWQIWVSNADTPLSVTLRATLPSALCASSQFASPAYRIALADLFIQIRYSPLRHPQSNSTERVMRELAIREPCMAESAPTIFVSSSGTPLSATCKETLPSALCTSSQFNSPARRKTLADLVIQCRYSPIHHPQRNHTERDMCDFPIREPCLGESARRFFYPVQILPYPPTAKQSHLARIARARNSRVLYGGKRWPIWLSSAGILISATRKPILPSTLCAISQFASPAWRKSLPNLGIQCRYSYIRHPQSNPTERVMRELAIREPCMAERFPI
jgi:transposase InsO family protein